MLTVASGRTRCNKLYSQPYYRSLANDLVHVSAGVFAGVLAGLSRGGFLPFGWSLSRSFRGVCAGVLNGVRVGVLGATPPGVLLLACSRALSQAFSRLAGFCVDAHGRSRGRLRTFGCDLHVTRGRSRELAWAPAVTLVNTQKHGSRNQSYTVFSTI